MEKQHHRPVAGCEIARGFAVDVYGRSNHSQNCLDLRQRSQIPRDWLAQGAAELGVVTLPAPGLETVELGTDEMVAVLPAQHELCGLERVPFEALDDERFILPTGGCGPLIMAAARRAGARLQVAFEAREQTAVLAMVAAGLGVSIMPTLGLPLDTGGVVTRPLEPHTPRTLALAVASPATATPAARAFLDHL